VYVVYGIEVAAGVEVFGVVYLLGWSEEGGGLPVHTGRHMAMGVNSISGRFVLEERTGGG